MDGVRFDWEAARVRLERSVSALASGVARSDADARRVLEERAVALARPLEDAAQGADLMEVLVFTRMSESFAIEGGAIVEVLRRAVPTPLPGQRGFLTGVVHHRGRVLGVVDVRALIVPGTPAPAAGYAIVVTDGALAFAIAADEIQGVATIADAAVKRQESAGKSKGPPWIRGTTADMVTVIDVFGLAKDARINVNESGMEVS